MAALLTAVVWAQGFPPRNGSVLPSTCTVGESYFLTTTTLTRFYECTATDTWTHVVPSEGGGSSWGGITGTLSNQTDLQTALDGKEASGTFSGAGTCAANQWASALNDGTAPTCTQPGFSNLSGSASDAQVPDNITVTLAGTATALAADPSDCATSTHFAVGVNASGTATCEAIADADVPNNITVDLATTATTANAGDSATGFFPGGAIEVARGGNGAAPGADDQILVSDSTSTATWRAIPDCDGDTTVLHYDTTTNTFSCGDDDTGAGGSDPWTYLRVNAGSDFGTTSATAVDVTGLAITPSANTAYELECALLLRTATATVNPRVGFAWSSGLTDGVAQITESQTATAAPLAAAGNPNAALLVAVGGLPNTTQSWPARVWATFVAGASPSGTTRVQLASETAGTNVTIRTLGSWCRYRTYTLP